MFYLSSSQKNFIYLFFDGQVQSFLLYNWNILSK